MAVLTPTGPATRNYGLRYEETLHLWSPVLRPAQPAPGPLAAQCLRDEASNIREPGTQEFVARPFAYQRMIPGACIALSPTGDGILVVVVTSLPVRKQAVSGSSSDCITRPHGAVRRSKPLLTQQDSGNPPVTTGYTGMVHTARPAQVDTVTMVLPPSVHQGPRRPVP
ncbi:hypothetical protein NDU88_002865 [Pleurodeles waltl]|uniref:Uncharacterized protein n=1 Tax=Pleurodeles waltl TaxID=8319 RepID=A0AAV7WQR3_PLEWA|nr:hypothetical protein NDU88_002865 [Pleurodeles waltl]